MMLISILLNLKIIQIPINYRERVGISSVTGSFKKAFILGLQMILLILKFRIMTVINKIIYSIEKVFILIKSNKV